MNFKGLDLNLLVALKILLEEKNVSRAAARMHVSQPAMSAALGRLRAYFDDDILVQYGKQMIPTPFVNQLKPNLLRVMTEAEELISRSSNFDPRITERTFRLMTSDYLITVLLAPLMATLERSSPNISFDIQLPSSQGMEQFERSEIDLFLTPDRFVSPNHPAEMLFEERFVIAGWTDNPIFDAPLTKDVFLQASHVAVAIGHGRELSYADNQLLTANIVRQVEIVAPSFSVLPGILRGTHRLAVIHERMARLFAASEQLRFVPLIVDMPPMREMMQHHSTRSLDSGLAWLRQTILRAALE